ncbi:FAD-dependent oxidoreductase [Lactobacillus sp. M0398]|uniref:FAD-dependent oxidoreductase n=1 Tax=unclassified Lactobacillus TaxID=2620435 RepID=UPI0018DD689F|nr:FAD-dependent oxidoreductase [Lactobacillus sp. M0398]MBI0122383.1 FAD-dependent oxidoreductase [Lactobacillus sp. W8174]MBI0134553.1 FAD-dependent oxidoreductase [Lactobacillus sp. W8173]
MKNLTSGTYQVVAHEYENEQMPIKVEISNNKISKIKTQKAMIPGSLEETVFTKIPKEIINEQSLSVDAISGATHSVNGLLDAVEKVIEQAGGNPQDFKTEADQKVVPLKVNTKKRLDNSYSFWRKKPNHIIKEYSTDFLIVGAGISGLAAAVQARQLKMDTIVIDKNGFVAGNGGGVEGIFGINTKMQQAAGIHAEKEDIIAKEAELGQYRADGSFWVDLINNSAANIDWLVNLGVQLTKVDDYHGTCMFPTFHWFKGGFASVGYVPYMKKKADELNVKFLLETSATSIIEENGSIKGVYAKTPNGYIKINAKATLLDTGGVGHNPDLLEQQGWSTKNIHYCSMPSNTGDGYQMAMSVGAKDMLKESPEFMMNYIQAFPHEGVHLYLDPINGFMSLPSGGPVIFVNQDGRRFVNENVKKYNLLYQRMAIKATKVSYEIFTQEIFDKLTQNVAKADEILAKALKENEGNSLFKANSIAELAEKVNLPSDVLVKTVNDYNSFCDNGKDLEFNKDQDMLISMKEGPYYIARLDPSNLIGLGGIGSNRKFEVINNDFEKIPGLYASGMDSTMQYRDVYTITLGGSACAHNVNSGRQAAKNAEKYIQNL